MPRYDYNCKKCNADKEIVHSIKETPQYFCLVCDTKLERVIRSTTFHLKGSGWFKPQKDN